MDDIDEILLRITTKVGESTLPEEEKADVYAQVSVGMRHLVWPILLAHVPKDHLEEATKKSKQLSVKGYVDLIDVSIKDPATTKEIHDELKEALDEVEELVNKSLN